MLAGLRPRERLASQGACALSEPELVALLLGTGDGRKSAVDLAESLLARFAGPADPTGLRGFVRASAGELGDVAGLGPAKVGRLLAARELGRRAHAPTTPLASLNSPQATYQLLAPHFHGLDQERFVVVPLNRKYVPLGIEVVSIGTLDSLVVHPREVFREAIRRAASAVVVAHNHPSGDPTPSAEDRALTLRLLEAGGVVGIPVLDHLVVGEGRFVSLRETTTLWAAFG